MVDFAICPEWKSVKEVILGWKRRNLTAVRRIYWSTLPHAILWAIWKERNRRVFEDKNEAIHKIIEGIKELVWTWGLESKRTNVIPLSNLMFNWDSVISS